MRLSLRKANNQQGKAEFTIVRIRQGGEVLLITTEKSFPLLHQSHRSHCSFNKVQMFYKPRESQKPSFSSSNGPEKEPELVCQ